MARPPRPRRTRIHRSERPVAPAQFVEAASRLWTCGQRAVLPTRSTGGPKTTATTGHVSGQKCQQCIRSKVSTIIPVAHAGAGWGVALCRDCRSACTTAAASLQRPIPCFPHPIRRLRRYLPRFAEKGRARPSGARQNPAQPLRRGGARTIVRPLSAGPYRSCGCWGVAKR